jgi:hypothetical protein
VPELGAQKWSVLTLAQLKPVGQSVLELQALPQTPWAAPWLVTRQASPVGQAMVLLQTTQLGFPPSAPPVVPPLEPGQVPAWGKQAL